ncbi:hypothetical protein Bpfe_009261 [Biomphalaria pfeifferi]|uniref:Uncharacterized protein n=1 Tax=Biomphalaria pfeifferi TaxID=112525 RepID=A0AAD8BX65_BIOPF|nr:hypothetical protein Bpfe_009261 [Biomphalaria pfeifferi]
MDSRRLDTVADRVEKLTVDKGLNNMDWTQAETFLPWFGEHSGVGTNRYHIDIFDPSREGVWEEGSGNLGGYVNSFICGGTEKGVKDMGCRAEWQEAFG